MTEENLVYVATNIKNGKRYVGATARGLKSRKRAHYKQAFNEGRKVKFHCALRRYGMDGFEWEVLSYHKSWKAALAAEKIFIARLKPEYNLTPGGEGNTSPNGHNSRKIVCLDDGKIFKSLADAGRYYGISLGNLTSVCRRRIPVAKGRVFRYFGEHLGGKAEAEEVRASTPRKMAWKKRKVICTKDGKIFDSYGDCAAYYGLSDSAVRWCCQGKYGYKSKKFMHYIGTIEKAA